MTRRVFAGLSASFAVSRAQKSLDILEMPPPNADARIRYGEDPFQFGDLRLPRGRGPHPVVIYIHGGFWKAAYSLEHAGHACAALTRDGAVTWSLEYRRIGNPGGGWPGTCEDVTSGAAHLHRLASKYALDLDRVVVAGHSAGGHLACWLAAQGSVKLRRVVSLAGVVDLRRAWELRLSSEIVAKFLGGSPQEAAEHYRGADPMELLPIRVPQRLIHGRLDDTVPIEISERFAKASRNAELIRIADAGHFELIDPRTEAWNVVKKAVLDLS